MAVKMGQPGICLLCLKRLLILLLNQKVKYSLHYKHLKTTSLKVFVQQQQHMMFPPAHLPTESMVENHGLMYQRTEKLPSDLEETSSKKWNLNMDERGLPPTHAIVYKIADLLLSQRKSGLNY
jgi:hypothetical protein